MTGGDTLSGTGEAAGDWETGDKSLSGVSNSAHGKSALESTNNGKTRGDTLSGTGKATNDWEAASKVTNSALDWEIGGNNSLELGNYVADGWNVGKSGGVERQSSGECWSSSSESSEAGNDGG
ncbi:hypothetical protein HBI79_015050 [Parastagonospora nodorum]|nr:hypothetical protein HBI79_015050 [Parastagonospora nodorum]KAH6470945.1 hypothetical protein HBI59_037090 [Parastagonospora nodorum]